MLYPDFNDLVAFKDRKLNLRHAAPRSVRSSFVGNTRSPFRGQGLEFDSVREYVPGDDIRNIDWRVTARTGSPHLKIFNEERERHRILCVDMNASMRFGTRKTFKSVQAAKVAAILGWQGLSEHDSVSTFLFGDVPDGIQLFAPKKTRKSFCSMLKMLSEPFTEEHFVPMGEALKRMTQSVHTGSLIYFISDFLHLDQPFKPDALSRINKRCEVIFIAVNDPADRALFPVGTFAFCKDRSEKVYVNTDSLSGRRTYADLWKENRERLYEITTAFKIPLIELTTESDLHRELVLGLKSIAKRKGR